MSSRIQPLARSTLPSQEQGYRRLRWSTIMGS